MMSRKLVALMVGMSLLTACSEDGVTGASLEGHSPQVASAEIVDISGTWNWSNVELVRMLPFTAVMLGISPEGPNTHARCESAGTMTLLQTAMEFHGTATKTVNSCETRGGQLFQQPGTFFVIEEGHIRGRSADFSFSSPTVMPCPHQAVISEVVADVASALSGSGRCILPGHPQSESPIALEPPPGGTSKTIRWEAVRQ